MKYINITLNKFMTLLVLITLSIQAHAINTDKKVLMVVSGYGQKQGQEKPGYEFDEFSKAYNVFKANGIEVDVASPKGGKVEADKYDASKSFNVPVLADKAIMSKLHNTLKTSELNADIYDGIFIVGGKGAMFDLPKDKALQSLIASIYQQQGSVAAVCHGPAALIDVQLKDGSYLVAGKTINGFTNTEENLFGKKWIKHFEFMLEDKLIERGGMFQSSPIMLSHVAVDERLITGQNPTSTTGVATALVKSLGITPIHTEQDIDDKTLFAVAKLLKGDKVALQELTHNQSNYNIALAGMYGFYFLKVAKNDTDFENALTLMLIAQELLNNPKIDMKIAKTQYKLGKIDDAKNTVKQLLKSKPNYQPAHDMIKTLFL